jgi:hypothetical protein
VGKAAKETVGGQKNNTPMIGKIKLATQLIRNMGWRYVRFRAWYEFRRRTGLLKAAFPTHPDPQSSISLEEWRAKQPPFFFQSKEVLEFLKRPEKALQAEIDNFRAGRLRFFNSQLLEIGTDYDWLTNPETGYRYDPGKHWTKVEDLSRENGDIKYVWEKSRFSYILSLIRYDYHFEEDLSEDVFAEIDSWMDANPINQGPNYKCSQEISLRVLNWTMALYYYSRSEALTEDRFQRILYFIYGQLHHVYQNIHFSRISVRNNHAITETAMLYLSGLLFPFFKETTTWSKKGKAWLEEELAYQIYEDGTHLQFSANYHRVVIQVVSWAFYLARLHGDSFSPTANQRAKASLEFLYQCQNEEDGYLPNFGSNDGALFFKLNHCAYRDYRPQLNALYYYFAGQHLYENGPWREDVNWFTNGQAPVRTDPDFSLEKQGICEFPKGGYYFIRDAANFSFIRCGKYKDRPAQADNLHLDIWVEGKNILRDAGTYKYNTDPKWIRYFNGTSAHNTVMLDGFDQMLKGPRFIWLYWTQAKAGYLRQTADAWVFEGTIEAFGQVAPGITHHRKIINYKEKAQWDVEDVVNHATGHPIHQYWNISPEFEAMGFKIEATDGQGNELAVQHQEGWYSGLYGVKEKTKALVISTYDKTIKTRIYR